MVKFPPLLPIVALTIRVVVLVVPLPVVASTSSPIATCPEAEIETSIGKLVTAGEERDNAIDRLSQCSNAAEALVEELGNNPNVEARSAVLEALEQIGAPAVDGLVKLLNDRNNPELARSLAIGVLTEIAQAGETASSETIRRVLQDRRDDLQESDLIRINADRALRQIGNPAAGRSIPEAIGEWIEKSPKISTGIWTVGGLLALYLLTLWLRPLWLLKLPATVKIPHFNIDIPVGVLHWLKYRPRVLDRWVSERLDRKNSIKFLKTDTVKDRSIHIPIPVRLGNEDVLLSAEKLKSIFKGEESCLIIVGDGGTGKTSLACQIARWGASWKAEAQEQAEQLCQHRMFPVLIDRDLEEDISLRDAIRNELPNPESISDELLTVLLQKKRILVVIDHISELNDNTYLKIEAALTKAPIEAPINALIMTSRDEKKNLGRSTERLEALEINQDNLSIFIKAYLDRKAQDSQQTEQDLKDSDFYPSCQKLSDMVADTLKRATVLLARLYADEIFEHKDQQGRLVDYLPDSIPALMLRYLNRLSASVSASNETEKRDKQGKIRRDAQVVAWECLKHDYKPRAVPEKDVVDRLRELDDGDENKPLERLLNVDAGGVGILQSVEPDKVKVILDPVAEYLAALYLVDLCQEPQKEGKADAEVEQRWRNEFFDTLEQKDVQEINGFLVAVYNCCNTYSDRVPSGKVPELVQNKLRDLAKLDPEELRQIRQRRQVNHLLNILQDAPDDDFRARIARDLGKMGDPAKDAIPALKNIVEKESETGWVRRSAAFALRQLSEMVPDLVVELQADGSESIHRLDPPLEPSQVWRVDLGNGVILEMVQIPAGSFWMGAAEGEEHSSDDEYPRHRVTIAKPFWMGRYPVTQAQWKAVADLPEVDQELDPDPSYFKGNDHPVERVSWQDAIEFCRRLSNHTGREYRLPSEAEWEYACRANTETSHHFGKIMTHVLANYGGSGFNKTTPVGYFAAANAFRLYDIHGNVWEWCTDHRHENYEGAPIDGSAWLRDDEDAYRMLRGGSWYDDPGGCRSAFRNYNSRGNRVNFFGFRVVCGLA